ncbi:MAG: von Willebrand factor type A [Candidatus Saganbacteria bacterium]|uniref:von Willebrand factor type A n=1 Tax=Candidatus Saganbacteria bacterium TaxID=2575572 RepID=A0A833KZX9_UNCSA|nr:MAG: von Willebrand factor type A [Candidatus Saganbacteria bacterium]
MRFNNFYWAIFMLALLYMWNFREKQKPAAIIHPDIISKLGNGGENAQFKARLPKAMRITALLLLILALMRPQQGFLSDTANKYGVDIMVALDVSSSMTAEDFYPNRISNAKRVLTDFINVRPNDRIGLIVFGSQSYVQCPLTNDRKTLLAFLEDVKVGMAEDGTAVGMALANSVKRLKDSQAKTKLILLLTDGDNNAGAVDPETAAKLAATYNIKIYAVGIGDPAGAPIPVLDPFGRKVNARNPDGSIFLTKMNAEGLKKIADITGGNYYIASDAGKFKDALHEIDRLEKAKFEAKTPFFFNEKFMVFAFPAFLLLMAEFFIVRFYLRVLP